MVRSYSLTERAVKAIEELARKTLIPQSRIVEALFCGEKAVIDGDLIDTKDLRKEDKK